MRQVIRFTLQTDKIRYRTNCWDTPCEGPKLANSLVTNTHFLGGGRVSWHLHAVPSHPFALAWFTHWIQQKFILLFIFTAADTTCPCIQDQNTTDILLEVAFNDTSFSRCATSTRGYFCSSLISSRYNINVLSTILIYFFFLSKARPGSGVLSYSAENHALGFSKAFKSRRCCNQFQQRFFVQCKQK